MFLATASGPSVRQAIAEHKCICVQKWIGDHDFALDPHSGAGNCHCGRGSGAGVHHADCR